MDNAPFSSSPPEHAQKPIATVLVVDDTPDNLTLMGSLLREHFQVKVANHGEKALKIALSLLIIHQSIKVIDILIFWLLILFL